MQVRELQMQNNSVNAVVYLNLDDIHDISESLRVMAAKDAKYKELWLQFQVINDMGSYGLFNVSAISDANPGKETPEEVHQPVKAAPKKSESAPKPAVKESAAKAEPEAQKPKRKKEEPTIVEKVVEKVQKVVEEVIEEPAAAETVENAEVDSYGYEEPSAQEYDFDDVDLSQPEPLQAIDMSAVPAIGDYVNAPRFGSVQIEEQFTSMAEAMDNGYDEPTYIDKPDFGVLGKNLGKNNYKFAAFPK